MIISLIDSIINIIDDHVDWVLKIARVVFNNEFDNEYNWKKLKRLKFDLNCCFNIEYLYLKKH